MVTSWNLLLQMLGLEEIITSEQMSVLVRLKRDFALALDIDFHKEKCLMAQFSRVVFLDGQGS